MHEPSADERTLWDRVTHAFERLERMPPTTRGAALAELDPAVRTRVEAMLASVEETGILDRADGHRGPGAARSVPASLDPGAQVGPFTLEAFVGRGGMGEVYRAVRTDASFQQRVALKLLRIDAVTDTALFARERRILSRLEHPSIARLIDGGTTASGRSWMAMAFVEGQPVDAWCRERAATLDERLRLFGDICDAVAFAHANLVVHRDLKPANVLVDARGRVQLLDFGIAKLIDDVGDEQTLVTSMLMTPQYAAPEQLEDGPITVATDVHALGILLYELVAGMPPWRSSGSLPSVVRRIVADDPDPPSRAAAAAATSPVPPAALRGDLDAIVLKALRKEPIARYASVADLADDVLRMRDLRPVAARAGSRRYRVQRFARRNRWAIAGVAAILLSILAGTVGVLIQAQRASVERDAALAEARRSDSMVQMLTLMLGQGGTQGDLTVKQTLDASAERLLKTLDGSERSAQAVAALSDLYVNIQDAKGSYDLITAALARGIGRDSPIGTAQLKVNLADTAMATGAPDDADALLDEAERVLGADPARNAVMLQNIVGTRAGLARRQRDYDRAVGLLLDTLPAAERAFAANDSALLTRYNNLLIYLLEANRVAEFDRVYARAAALIGRGNGDAIQALGIRALHGNRQLRGGDPAAAERTFAGVADRRMRLFGESPGLANDWSSVGRARLAEGRPEAALQAFAIAQPMLARFLGPKAIPVLVADMARAEALAELHRPAEARQALTGVRAAVAAMPATSPIGPQLALTDTVLAVNEGDRSAATAAATRARAALVQMGPPGAYYLSRLAGVERRIAALR